MAIPTFPDDVTASGLVTGPFASQVRGKTVLITGVSPGGLGAATAEAIALGSPALLILAGRDAAKTRAEADAIVKATPAAKVRTLALDLGSQAKVRKAAAQVMDEWTDVERIDVLINNAGIMALNDFTKTEDGLEAQFGTNHVGHWLFTNLIMDKLLKSGSPRVVNVSSDGHRLSPIRFGDWNFGDGANYNKWQAYGQSKTANVLMGVSLAQMLSKKGLVALSVHPGVIWSNLGSHLDWENTDTASLKAVDIAVGSKFINRSFKFKNHDQGAATQTYCAFAPGLEEVNGSYFQDCRLADPYEDEIFPWATNKVEAEKLWKLTEKLVGQEFKY